MTRDEGRRGIVLVTVLWSIALLSALAMSASLTFREFAGVMAVSRDRVQADALLTAGLEMAAGVLSDPEQPLADTELGVDLSTGSVRVRLADEGGRIDIGKVPAAVLAALLRSAGAPAAAAEQAARQIVEQRGDRADSAVRRSGDAAARRPRNEPPFTDVRQLATVPGMAPEWIAAIAPLTTVFGSETVNPLTAPAAVIAALPGVDQGRLEAFLATRRASSPDPDRLGQLLGPAQQYVSTKPQKVASVELAARLPDGYTTAARAVITLLPQDSQPYRVLLWQPMASFRFR